MAYTEMNAVLRDCHFQRQRAASGRTRRFSFIARDGRSVSLEIREQPGLQIGSVTWGGAEALCAALCAGNSLPAPLRCAGARVLELGAGTGLAGLFCAHMYGARVTLTDQAPLLPLLRANAARAAGAAVSVRELAWGHDDRDNDACDKGSDDDGARAVLATPEVLLMADVVYDMRVVEPLLAEIRRVLLCDGAPPLPARPDLHASDDQYAAPPPSLCCAVKRSRGVVVCLLAYKRRDVGAERAFFSQLRSVGVVHLRVVTAGCDREEFSLQPTALDSPIAPLWPPWPPETEARLVAGSTEVFEMEGTGRPPGLSPRR